MFGCSTLNSKFSSKSQLGYVYSGVNLNIQLNKCLLPLFPFTFPILPFTILDLPLSFVADTIFIPIDLYYKKDRQLIKKERCHI